MSLPLPLLPKPVRYSAVVVVAAIIIYGSLITVPETAVDDIRFEFFDPNHWRHLVAYATLAYTLAYATDHWDLPSGHHAAVIIALATLFGIAMEVGQAFLPHRSPFLVTDVIINAIGASSVLVWFLLRPYIELTPHFVRR